LADGRWAGRQIPPSCRQICRAEIESHVRADGEVIFLEREEELPLWHMDGRYDEGGDGEALAGVADV